MGLRPKLYCLEDLSASCFRKLVLSEVLLSMVAELTSNENGSLHFPALLEIHQTDQEE